MWWNGIVSNHEHAYTCRRKYSDGMSSHSPFLFRQPSR